MDVDAGLVHVSNLRGVHASGDGVDHDDDDGNGGASPLLPEAALDVRALTREFVEYYRLHNNHFVYMEMLRDNLAAGLYFLEVQLTHLQQFSGLLFSALQQSPTRTLPLMESAVAQLAQDRQLYAGNAAVAAAVAAAAAAAAAASSSGDGSSSSAGRAALTSVQVQCFWPVPPLPLRQLGQATVARLVCVSGIVVKASASHARCVRAVVQCTSCRSKAYLSGARALELPPQCLENGNRNVVYDGGMAMSSSTTTTTGGGGGGRRCRPNPYVLLPMECTYEDQQVLKLQELPEDVPTGELPRHVTVVVDRYLVDRVSPGTRVQVVGIVSVQEQRGGGGGNAFAGKGRGGRSGGGGGRATVGLRAQYLRCVGLMYLAVYTSLSSSSSSSTGDGTMTDATTSSSSYNNNSSSSGGGGGGCGVSVVSVNHNYSSRVRSRSALSWQPEEEASFKAFAKSGDVYAKLTRSLDPAIYGLLDQKRAVVCLLFGGTRKRHGSNYLRGDMNVLFIGDPSTAKSQLLKFTEKVAPIGVYTSGKGSSAAGLTASVLSHGNGEFVLEAGSMVLADGGVVCIDEFDKMRAQDQVAIHEAMEQQTISIAKASLTTMLNSRTSVLAAANPTLGSYDPLRSDAEQLDFQGSILSRFDLIFKVVDPRNPELDHRLAQHVVNLHKGGSGGNNGGSSSHRYNGSNAMGSSSGSGVDGPVVERGFFTKYIAYARATCYPTLSEEAMTVLLDFYVRVRRDAHRQTLEAMSSSSSAATRNNSNSYNGNGSSGRGGSGVPAIQITARQLESLVRITEALARMRLDVLASRSDAEEAIRLFKAATVDAMNSGLAEQTLTEAQSEVVLRIEEALRRRVALGATVEHNRLLSELMRMGFDARLVDRAVYAMVRREELEWRKQRTLLYRAR